MESCRIYFSLHTQMPHREDGTKDASEIVDFECSTNLIFWRLWVSVLKRKAGSVM